MLLFLLISLFKSQAYVYVVPVDQDSIEVYVAAALIPSQFISVRSKGTAEIAVEIDHKKNVIYGNFWYIKFDTTTPSPFIKIEKFKIEKLDKFKIKLRISNSKTGEVIFEHKEEKKLKDYCHNNRCLSDPIPISNDSVSWPTFSGDSIRFRFFADTSFHRLEVKVGLYQEEKSFEVPIKGVVLTPVIERKGSTVFDVAFEMPDSLRRGKYIAKFEVILDNVGKFVKDAFFVFKKGGSVLIGNLDDYIPALVYIAPYSEVKKIEKAPPSEKMKLWKEFWKEHDPTPGTPENELEEEFIERVAYANEHFSIGRFLGSLTDRGRVYIKLGPPDEIDNHPFDINTLPYQVWYYYEKNLTIVFVDRGGFGDYELYYPPDLFDRIN